MDLDLSLFNGSVSTLLDHLTRHYGEDAKLDLRIIRDHELSAFAGPETSAIWLFVRDLLKIRIGAREPPGRRSDLAKIGMNAAGFRFDKLQDILAETGHCLRNSPVFEQLCDDGIFIG